jgi:two-component system, LytTR family, sensor histidine kinase AlgZ
MSPTAHDVTPLDSLWQGRVVIWVVLAGEGLAAILTLASDADSRWVRFGLISLLVQWIALLTLGVLYLFRKFLSRLKPQLIAYIAMLCLLCSTWWVVMICLWLLEASGGSLGSRSDLLLRVSLIALVVGWLGLAAFQNHWRAGSWPYA